MEWYNNHTRFTTTLSYDGARANYALWCETLQNHQNEFAKAVLAGKIQEAKYASIDPGKDVETKYEVWTGIGWYATSSLDDAESRLATVLGTEYQVVHEARKAARIQPLAENGE